MRCIIKINGSLACKKSDAILGYQILVEICVRWESVFLIGGLESVTMNMCPHSHFPSNKKGTEV